MMTDDRTDDTGGQLVEVPERPEQELVTQPG